MNDSARHEKVFVAVHGVGDQFSFETIQAVARQVFKYWELPGALSLGSLYSRMKQTPQDKRAPGLLRYREVCHRGDPPPCSTCRRSHDPAFGCVSFAEVYWARIPRSVVSDGHTIEETKSWVKTVVERLRRKDLKNNNNQPLLARTDYRTIKEILMEMVAAVKVLQLLVGWLEKHTSLRFPLKKLLDEYVCDVQVVTEFRQLREQILEEFSQVMRSIREDNPHAKIYVIAHSEGTVVSFLSLLTALSRPEDTDSNWIENIHGFMTLGSPIDKHLILWPELWHEFEGQQNAPCLPVTWRTLTNSDGTPRCIPWYNYYDYGDPVGFNLDTARDWMRNRAGKPPFDFRRNNDIGFSRYVFPGKAHVDYWRDGRLFAHFFENVVLGNELPRSPLPPPRSLRWVRAVSATFPYLMVSLVCCAATYLLYKATSTAFEADPVSLLVDVPLLGLSLAAVTSSGRLPRLARTTWAAVTSGGLALIGVLIPFVPFAWVKLASLLPDLPFHPIIIKFLRHSQLLSGALPKWWALPATAGAIAAVGWFSSSRKPLWGMIPMLLVGLAGISVPVAALLATKPSAAAWPVVVAGMGSIYLWWIAALLFDLSVVWHRYICLNTGMEKLHALGRVGKRKPRAKVKFAPRAGEPEIEAMKSWKNAEAPPAV